MPSRFSEKTLKITRSRSPRPQYNPPLLLVPSGRHLPGSFWPPPDWYYAPADSQHGHHLRIRGRRHLIQKQTITAIARDMGLSPPAANQGNSGNASTPADRSTRNWYCARQHPISAVRPAQRGKHAAESPAWFHPSFTKLFKKCKNT